MRTPLALRLKALAHEADMTAEQMAKKLGVSASAVRAWWSGRNEPSLDMLTTYAAVLARPVVDLLPDAERIQFERLCDERLKADMLADEVLPVYRAHVRVIGATTTAPPPSSADTTHLREALAATVGQDWMLLTEEERRAVVQGTLDRIEALAAPRRAGGGE